MRSIQQAGIQVFVIRQLVISWALSFFICGALLFPVLNPYYLGRVLGSLGIVGVINGIESVLRAGHITSCGFLSGNCEEHSFRVFGVLLFLAIFAWRMHAGDRDAEDSAFAETVSEDSRR